MPGSQKLGQHNAPAPSLAPGTELIGEYQGSGFREPVFLVRRSDGQVIQLSRLVYLVASETNGQKDFGQIAERVSSEFGRTLSAENVRFLVENKLRPLGLVAANDGPAPKLMRAKPVLALKFRVPIMPRGAILALAAVFRPLFVAPVVIAMLAGLAALDIWLFFVHGLVGSAQEVLYRPELIVVVFVLTLLATLVHELGHATACHYGGAKPGRIGVGLYIVWPVFFNDVTDTYRLGKIGRLRTDLGGVYFDVIFTLAIAGAYFLTGAEWLLLMMFLAQLDILSQFMPFLRLDGYYVVSDLTGVPDLFARITPILKSLIPGRGTDRRVNELKPWVRVVVTVWVLTAIPALLCVFGMLIASAPQLYATAWDSFLNYQDKVQGAFADGRVVAGVANLIQIVLLLIPVAGVTLLFLLVGKRLGGMLWGWSRGRPALRAALGTVVLSIGAILPFFLWPPDSDDKPLQRAQHVTFQGATVPELPTRGDGPTPERADEDRTPLGERGPSSASPKPTGYASAAPTSAAPTSAPSASASSASAPSASAPSASAPSASGGSGRAIVRFEMAGLAPGSTAYIQASANATTTFACINVGGQIADAANMQTTISRVSTPPQAFTAHSNGNVRGTLPLNPPSAESNTLVCPSGRAETLQSVTYTDAVVNRVA